jgi:hypothetical protein
VAHGLPSCDGPDDHTDEQCDNANSGDEGADSSGDYPDILHLSDEHQVIYDGCCHPLLITVKEGMAAEDISA